MDLKENKKANLYDHYVSSLTKLCIAFCFRWRLHNIPGKCVQMFEHTQSKKSTYLHSGELSFTHCLLSYH